MYFVMLSYFTSLIPLSGPEFDFKDQSKIFILFNCVDVIYAV